MNKKFPARLHILLAREKPVAVVFRRGPSKQTCTFLWNRENNNFTKGQWLKGRIYERRADLSPDGKYLIYFAMNGKWTSETKGSWTAISKPPWLKAIDLICKGDCWEGGGLFLTNRSYWLNDRYFTPQLVLKKSGEILRDTTYKPEGDYGAECPGVYYRRLIRDGWKLKERINRNNWNSYTIFEKELSKSWVLRKIAHEEVNSPAGKGCYWDEHELINEESENLIKCKDWEWAELDGNYIIWASKGCLYKANIQSRSKIGVGKLLHDFNDYKFEEIKAPY